MRKAITVLTIFTLLLLTSCKEKSTKKESKVNLSKNTVAEKIKNKDFDKGFQLLESSCFSCHSPDVTINNKIAPTIADIKKYYITEEITNENFTNSLIDFVNNPIEKKSIIPQAILRYGLMPKFDLSKEDLSQIAKYIYSTEIGTSDWYTNQYEKEKMNNRIDKENLSYVALGKHYVMSTKSILGKNLKGSIKSKGTENAVEFCNARAYPLTDSMAVVLNTKIKRVSDRPRNLLNKASEAELNYIYTSNSLAKGSKIKPQIQEVNGKMIGYYPIMTSKMCLQCHGKPNSQIKPSTLKKLNSLYPKDMAKGYAENELRGIWVVEMNKKKTVTEEK